MGRLKMIEFKREIMKVQSNLTVAWFVCQRAQSSHSRAQKHVLHFEPKEANFIQSILMYKKITPPLHNVDLFCLQCYRLRISTGLKCDFLLVHLRVEDTWDSLILIRKCLENNKQITVVRLKEPSVICW